MSKVVREERRVERDGSGRGPPEPPPCSVGVSSRRGLQSTTSMRAARQGALALLDHGNGLSSRSRTACGLIVRCSLRSLVPAYRPHGNPPRLLARSLGLTCHVELNCVDDMTVASCEVKSGEDDRIFVRLRIDGPLSIHYLTRLEDKQQLATSGHRRGSSKSR
jgi:hypothetical protein